MQLVITDVTEMSAGNYCVAGWDVDEHRMVRPLPGGHNWTAAQLAQHGIDPGALLDFTPTGHPHNGAYPHRTEDTQVHPNHIVQVNAGPYNWFGPNGPASQPTVAAAFPTMTPSSVWNNVRKSPYVAIGTQGISLAAIVRPRNALQFVENQFGDDPPKLRVILNDGAACYNLAVSSRAIKSAWRQHGLQGIHNALPASPNVHVRLGLARAFGNPADRCYMMLNGVHG